MAEEKLFLRKATGLVREIGFSTAVILILCNVIGLGWQKKVFQASGWAPVKAQDYVLGLNPVVMSFLLVGIALLFTVYCVAVMSAAMPRSGGGYVFISRLVNPGVGFVAAWLTTMSTALAYGIIAVAAFEILAYFAGVAGVLPSGLLDAISQPFPLLIEGVIIILIFSGIASLGIAQFGRFLQVIFWVPAAILLVVYFLFLTTSGPTMAAGIKSLFNVADPAAYTAAAIKGGIDKAAPAGGYWAAVGTATLATYFAYGGYYAASFVAGEVKEASKNMPKILFTGAVIIIFVYMSVSTLSANAASSVGQQSGWNFFNAINFLNYGDSSVKFKDANLPAVGGYMSFMAMISASGAGLGWLLPFITLFAVLWILNDIPPFILTSSRTIFAMAFDRVFPEKFGEISEKYHSPIWAIVLVSVVGVLGAIGESEVLAGLKGGPAEPLYTVLSSGGILGATDIFGAIFEVFLVLAAVMLPIRKPEVLERSAWSQNKGRLQTLAVIAVISQIAQLLVLMADPHGYGFSNLLQGKSVEWTPVIFTIIVAAIGAGFYWYYSNKAKATGVSMTTIFTEIPPE